MKNNLILSITFAVFISAIIGKTSIAQDMFKDNFSNNEQWRYIADDVMGGVSSGNVEYNIIEEDVIAVLKGNVQQRTMVVLYKLEETLRMSIWKMLTQ